MLGGAVKPGDVLGGKYAVERVLGAGGMGVVVAAKHVDLGQRVAIKFMLAEAMTDPAHAERFLREARSAVRLKSAHAARVLDVGRLGNGEPFMVMEYLEGRDLDAELQARGPLPPHVAIDYVLQVSEALAEAHGLGMIHRDVKLKNLFLTASVDGRPLVKVLDFGLAKTIGPHGDVSLTATSSVFGSPQYMSPEQMRSAKDVDSRSDVWSLGVCLYELLTGRVPFDAPSVAEICAMVLKEPAPPPSQHMRGLSVELDDVVLKCLEKDLSRRFQSVAELAFALQAFTTDEGAARRILHVMRSAQEIAHAPPKVVVNDAEELATSGATTMKARDSGAPTRRADERLMRPQHIGAFVGIALMGFVGAGGIMLAVTTRAARPAESAPSPSPSPSPAASSSAERREASPAPSSRSTKEPPPSSATEEPAGPAAKAAKTTPAGGRPKPSAPGRPASPPPAKATATATASTVRTPPEKPKTGPGSGGDYM